MNKKYKVLLIFGLVGIIFGSVHTLIPEIDEPDFADYTPYGVTRIIDGDTIIVSDDIRVRLIGVDTPETVHPQKPFEHYGKEASLFVTNLLKGEKVYLIGGNGVLGKDRYGRKLAFLYRYPDGLFVNAEIIRQGYGHAYIEYPFEYLEEFLQLERFARRAEKGLWVKHAEEIAESDYDLKEKTEIVYITQTGTKYHKKSCSHLRESKIEIKLKEAKWRDYEPCESCVGKENEN